MAKRERIDKRLVDLGLAETRTKAQALVMSGVVLINERPAAKSSDLVSDRDIVRIKSGTALPYVGRGGLKLEKALKEFDIRPAEYVCLDVGASTGGFTDCLLQNGAKFVYAIDAGTNQLDWKIRSDSRVEAREKVNARYLKPDDFPEPFDLIVMDVSFISITKILPALADLIKENGRMVSLIKPQFEAGRGEVGKGGIVKDPETHKRVIKECLNAAETLGFTSIGVTESPIRGATGNTEFLACFEFRRSED
ncbi:MAG: TlyA family RNA methyltransferase [Pyrinomonadaceae bacterium]